jgi:hypothetical protein
MPFHSDQLEAVKRRIEMDLSIIDTYGSVKLFACWYDHYQITDAEWKGIYPCCEHFVHIKEVIDIVKEVFKQPCIIRHNVLKAQAVPAFFMDREQYECEKYVEVCLIQNGNHM